MGSTISVFHSVLLGELPPPAPRDCFGREELVEKIVGLAENLEPVALIGSGGIGKTFIALTVLHHKRIKERFGENRRFIRCDQFPASRAHLLTRISEVIGAGVENPKDLTPLRPLLSSKEMLIILDNAESILDPEGTNPEEIYSVVNELSQFPTICLCITSRITTVPPRCKRPEIPTLSMEAASDIFYSIHGDNRRSSIITDLLHRLDFHALSITLLATTASHNAWDYDRLAMEWDTQRAKVLQAGYNKSLAATIELSLTSPTFFSLGPNARDLLAVVAFFPQGVDEKNLDWLFPTIPDRKNIFDKFCLLSLTYRSNGFVSMLAPIRDYLGPRDPQSSALLCTTRDRYFSRMKVDVDINKPGYKEARWILTEDVNVEHLLDVFASISPGGEVSWDACFNFMRHLYSHKPRQIVLGPKIEALPDDHPSKPKCLFELSRLLGLLGNYTEQKRLFTHSLRIQRHREDEFQVAESLRYLSSVNRLLGFHKEGIPQAEESLEIYERRGDIAGKIQCLIELAWLLSGDNQLDAAENAASRAIDIASGGGREFFLCSIHRTLGKICGWKGDKKKAIYHFETALGIATPFNWQDILFWSHFGLAVLFLDEGEFDDASAHTERAKSIAVDDAYQLARATHLQARIWYRQHRLEDAKSGASRALETYEKLGAADTRVCRDLLQLVEREIANRTTGFQRELLEVKPPPSVNVLFLA